MGDTPYPEPWTAEQEWEISRIMIGQIEGDRDIAFARWINHINLLDTTNPHGKCLLCDRPITAWDAKHGDSHIACLEDEYGED